MNQYKPIEYNDETHTIAEWARIKGIPPNRLARRLRDGWSLSRALTADHRTRLITIDGVSKSVTDWCNHFGQCTPTAARVRIRKGVDPVIAVSAKRIVTANVERWRCRVCSWTGVKRDLASDGVFKACPACNGRVMRVVGA